MKPMIPTLLLGLGALSSCDEPSPAVKEPVQQEVQATVVDLTLGNVRFQLQNPETVSEKKKQELLSSLQAAYRKLHDFLGDEIMSSSEPRIFKVYSGPKAPRGLTRWSAKMSFDLDANPREVSIGDTELFLGDTSEDNVAHELFHLYAQAPVTVSKAFYEGHAHGLIRHLYPDTNTQGDLPMMRNLLSSPDAEPILRKGWDYTVVDEQVKGGIKDKDLNNFVTLAWEKAWFDFEKENPSFFKAFYQEVAARRVQEGYVLTREEMIEIGAKIHPLFKDWFSKQAALQLLGRGKDGEQPFVGAVMAGNRVGMVFNFELTPAQISGTEGDMNYKPGSVASTDLKQWMICSTLPPAVQPQCQPLKSSSNASIVDNPNANAELSLVVDGKIVERFRP